MTFQFVESLKTKIIANEGVSWIDADIKYVIANTNPITFRNSINGYRLQGAHMPTDYDMITRVRAKEHVSDQIHLVTAHEL